MIFHCFLMGNIISSNVALPFGFGNKISAQELRSFSASLWGQIDKYTVFRIKVDINSNWMAFPLFCALYIIDNFHFLTLFWLSFWQPLKEEVSFQSLLMCSHCTCAHKEYTNGRRGMNSSVCSYSFTIQSQAGEVTIVILKVKQKATLLLVLDRLERD